MNKALIGILAATLLAAPLAITNAQTTTPMQKRFDLQQRQEERREALEQKHEEIQNRFEAKRAELQETRQQRIAAILDRVVDRMQSAIDRLESFADRVQARIDLLEDDGEDLDDAQGHLDGAQDTLDDAQEALNDIDPTDILDDIGTTTPSAPIAELRTQLGEVKELIKQAHGQIVDAIVAIKEGLDDDEDDD